MKRLSNSFGFGLLGMIALIFLVSLGGGLVYIVLTPSAQSIATAETVEKARRLREAINNFKSNRNGTAPAALTDLVTDDLTPCVPDNNPASGTYLTLQGWCGPYIDQVYVENLDDYITDGWKTVFQYNAGTTIITSCGPDRTCSTADDITFSP